MIIFVPSIIEIDSINLTKIIIVMASLNQLISEMAHSLGQPNNYALRENLKNIIIHTRNELIRHSYEQHGYIDAVMQQKYKVSIQEVNDANLVYPEGTVDLLTTHVFRTIQKVPRPVRLTNNLPFTRVSNDGYLRSHEIPYIKESSARFRHWLPGMRVQNCYDYINDYIYIFPNDLRPITGTGRKVNDKSGLFDSIVIQAAFENPVEVKRNSGEGAEYLFEDDDDEWFLPEDMIGQIKDIVYKRDLVNIHRENDETPNTIKSN